MPNEDVTAQVVNQQLKEFRSEYTELRSDLKDVLKEVAGAVNKLVALESTQTAMIQAYGRLEKQIEKTENKFEDLEKRIDVLEKEQPETKRVVGYAYKALWLAAAAAIGFIAKAVGLM